MNFVEVAGHLGADAEERFTPSGKRVIGLRLAAKVRQGGKDETIWWRISIWNDRYDKMLPYLRKGTAVIVFGEMMKPEIYVDKSGISQISMSMSAEVIRFSPFGKGGEERNSSGFSQDKGQQDRSGQNDRGGQQRHSSGFDQEEVAALVGGEDNGFTNDDLPF